MESGKKEKKKRGYEIARAGISTWEGNRNYLKGKRELNSYEARERERESG